MIGNNRLVDVLNLFIADVNSRRGRLKEIADATGVHPKVLQNIRYGKTKDPRGSNLERLRAFYESKAA